MPCVHLRTALPCPRYGGPRQRRMSNHSSRFSHSLCLLPIYIFLPPDFLLPPRRRKHPVLLESSTDFPSQAHPKTRDNTPPPVNASSQTAMRVAEQNTECLMRAQENGKPDRGGRAAFCEPKDDQPATQADFCCGDRAQVRVRKLDGLDELSWGELEGHDSSQEPWKSKLADLKAGWDAGQFDRCEPDVYSASGCVPCKLLLLFVKTFRGKCGRLRFYSRAVFQFKTGL